MSKKIEPYQRKKLPTSNKGTQMVQEKYRGKFTLEEIRNKAQEVSNYARDNYKFYGKMSVSVKFDDYGWRSGYFRPFGEDVVVDMYNYDDDDGVFDQNNFTEFHIYVTKDGDKKGGTSKRNDCLYDCLKKAIAIKDFPWKYPSTFKKAIGVERNDKIHIDLIPLIEQKLEQYKINITGDHVHTSTKECQRVINIKLVDGHYKLDTSKPVVYLAPKAFVDKKVLFYQRKSKTDLHSVYDKDNGLREITKAELRIITKNPITSDFTCVPATDPKKIIQEHDQFIKDADKLKELSDGLINMYRTGSHFRTSLQLFSHFNKTITAEPITQVESEWITNATNGALIFVSDKYKGPAYQYDVISHYPSLMSHKLMFFPIKCGTFHNITTDEFKALKTINYGIYRCTVEYKKSVFKHFRYNKLNYYTHIDLTVAKELQLNIEMAIDNQPNQLKYARSDMVTGSQLFKPYFDYLFQFKNQGIKTAKSLINVLWGALCQKNLFKKYQHEDDEEIFDIKTQSSIYSICPKNNKQYLVEYVKNNNVYETNFARILPFVLARGRQIIRKHMKNHMNDVLRCHTDGWITKTKQDIKTGSNMGDIKYVGYCDDVTIENNITVEGEFKL